MIRSPDSQTTRLNPVRLPKGHLHQFDAEFLIPGTLSVEIVRAYNPAFTGPSPLGVGYLTSLDLTITDSETDGHYDVLTLDGIAVRFERPPPQLFSRSYNDSHRHLSLEPLPRGGLKLNDRKESYTFQRYRGRVWRIIQIEDLNGNIVRLDRDQGGALTELHHPDGLRLRFTNDAAGLRTGYDIIGLDDSTLVGPRFAYDDMGRLNAVLNPFGENWCYAYDALGNRILADNGAGTRTVHQHDAENRVIEVDTGGSYKQGRIAYHPTARQVTVYHGVGDDTFEKLWFDGQNRHFMTSDAAGRFSYRGFNDNNDLISETDENGHVTQYEFDADGNPQSTIDPEGRETFMVWDDQANLISMVDHAGNSWDYEYDEKGNIEQSRNPLGHVTNFRSNDAGLPAQMMRHDGLIEFRVYDDLNRLTQLIDFNSAETKFEYDPFNRVVQITDPAGHVTQLDYVAQNGCDFHTPSRVIRADGVTTQRDFGTTGKVEAVTDGEGRTTRYTYGPYNVLEAICDPRGNDLRFQYDSQERLTQVTNQMGLHWTFERDRCGRVLRETDFDGRTLAYTYDAGGRVIRRDNPDGSFLEYDYDKSGLLLEMRAFADCNTAPLITFYAYDDNGALISAKNADATIELMRDALGRVTSETVNGVTIESEIDCCGLRSRRRIGDQEVHYTYDGMGGLTSWTVDGFAPLTLTRDALGQEIFRDNGTGFSMRQTWDTVGQLRQQQIGDVAGRHYEWSKAYEPTEIVDTNWGTRRYDYDANGQIARTTHGDGQVENFAYTPDLNLSGTGDSDKFMNWQTTAAGVVKLARGPNGEVVTLEHDACGRVVQRTVARNGFRPQTWRFGWNAQDQMVSAHCPDGDVWTYAYDPFGRRVSKSCKHTKVTFIWDGDVIAREVTERRAEVQSVDWFFEPGSFRPMARLERGDLTYVINDHLGTPKEVIGGDGALRWSADHDTWGTLRTRAAKASTPIETGNYWIEPTSIEGNTERAYVPEPDHFYCPIRFQGQWEDAETGLFQNRFRFYDPFGGQYLGPDPIGVWAGFRLHGYVVFPSTIVDPFGLERTYVTYRGIDALTGKPYAGYASMPGANQSFRDVMNYRYGSNFDRFTGGQMPAEIYSGPDKATARGLEQRTFEADGGLEGTANKENPVGPNNARRDEYLEAADKHSGCCRR